MAGPLFPNFIIEHKIHELMGTIYLWGSTATTAQKRTTSLQKYEVAMSSAYHGDKLKERSISIVGVGHHKIRRDRAKSRLTVGPLWIERVLVLEDHPHGKVHRGICTYPPEKRGGSVGPPKVNRLL